MTRFNIEKLKEYFDKENSRSITNKKASYTEPMRLYWNGYERACFLMYNFFDIYYINANKNKRTIHKDEILSEIEGRIVSLNAELAKTNLNSEGANFYFGMKTVYEKVVALIDVGVMPVSKYPVA